MLGHADPGTTMRYAHLDQAALLASAEKNSGFISGSFSVEIKTTAVERHLEIGHIEAESDVGGLGTTAHCQIQ